MFSFSFWNQKFLFCDMPNAFVWNVGRLQFGFFIELAGWEKCLIAPTTQILFSKAVLAHCKNAIGLYQLEGGSTIPGYFDSQLSTKRKA